MSVCIALSLVTGIMLLHAKSNHEALTEVADPRASVQGLPRLCFAPARETVEEKGCASACWPPEVASFLCVHCRVLCSLPSAYSRRAFDSASFDLFPAEHCRHCLCKTATYSLFLLWDFDGRPRLALCESSRRRCVCLWRGTSALLGHRHWVWRAVRRELRGEELDEDETLE